MIFNLDFLADSLYFKYRGKLIWRIEMEIRKIEKFKKHTEDSYSVWYEGLGDNRCCMSAARYKLASCIDGLLRRAIAREDIKQLVDLTRTARQEEILEAKY